MRMPAMVGVSGPWREGNTGKTVMAQACSRSRQTATIRIGIRPSCGISSDSWQINACLDGRWRIQQSEDGEAEPAGQGANQVTEKVVAWRCGGRRRHSFLLPMRFTNRE